ncbi:MAG: serine/threonine protein kinase [Syntrophobacterales bacterium]|nr:MAG: serine/threonine protein kinase [Syntrophobacterales bacterium]
MAFPGHPWKINGKKIWANGMRLSHMLFRRTHMAPDKQSVGRIKEILSQAKKIEGGTAREEFLKQACGDDSELRKEVESLLEAFDITNDFLSRDASGGSLMDFPDLVGTMIDNYRLEERIGEGGFGEVYRATQIEPLHREVALKIVKLGMDSKNVLIRFEAERQAMARMNHPGIAQAYDAGATASGRPYFVMELVRGIPIVEYCDKHRLPMPDRIELFRQVCEAVQHAHQKGILHRDLKPSNILVSEENGKPLPKIIDFGVAKSLEGRLTEQTLATLQEMLIGTPMYMSPEQLSQETSDIDTRSDIYSLGVILYELVAGTTPLDHETLTSLTMAGMRQVLAEEGLPRPSKRFVALGKQTTVIANKRQIKPPSLERLLRGDLDWVVMKALEKERDRRYDDVGGLSEDLERYLNHEPVLAGPPSVAYRSRKFIRRHRMASAVIASVSIALLLGAVVSTIGFLRASSEAERARRQEMRAIEEAERARQQQAIAEATFDFIRKDLMWKADPRMGLDRDVKLRTVIDQAADRIEHRFKEQPLVCARIHRLMSYLYLGLGEYEKALKHAEESVRLTEQELDQEHPDYLDASENLAMVYMAQGRYAEAEPLIKRTLESRENALDPNHSDVARSLNLMANLYRAQGLYAEAEPLYQRALAIFEKTLEPDHPYVATSLNNLAALYRDQGRYAEAEPLYNRALAIREKVLGPDHPAVG